MVPFQIEGAFGQTILLVTGMDYANARDGALKPMSNYQEIAYGVPVRYRGRR
jgi:hypothetical protein